MRIPLGRIPLLLDLCENALRLVIDAVCARGHLPIAFDLLLPTHIAGLRYISLDPCAPGSEISYPRDPPPLGLIALFHEGTVGEHWGPNIW